MRKASQVLKIFISLEVKVRYVSFLIIVFLSFSIPLFQPATANSISGNHLKNLVIEELSSSGVESDPAIDNKRIFHGCAEKHIKISRRDESWNTLKVTCEINKSWTFNFRNKIYTRTKDQRQFNRFSEEHSSDTQKGTKSYNREDLVFVLTNAKQKDEILNKADVKLELRKRILSNGGFSEVKPILGKKLRRNLKKGSILKEKHLMKDWLVHKNQKIEIENQVGSIKVTMQGLALSNGLKGDRILVKNLSSNKTIEGFVKSEKKISIFRKIY